MEILHSKIYGETQKGLPLLVFHGLFGMLDNWASFAKDLSQDMPVHLLDLRNHGKSFHSPEMSHEALAEDILNYMQDHGLEKVNLLGHSLGGKAVMQFAVRHAEKAEMLLVADIGPKAYPPHHQGILKALAAVDFTKVKTRQEVETVLAGFIPEKSVIQFLTKNLYWTDEKNLAWRFNLKILTEKYAEFVSNAIGSGVFSGPTLFLAGEKSEYILPQDLPGIKEQFPAASVVTIPAAGHWVQAENPAAFNLAVRTFLQQDQQQKF